MRVVRGNINKITSNAPDHYLLLLSRTERLPFIDEAGSLGRFFRSD
jgi:hypothetical protein